MASMSEHLPAIGTFIRAGGTLAQGAADMRAARFEARGLRRAAKGAIAESSHEVAEGWRAVRDVQSRARAVSAASGGGVATDVIADIEAEGEHRALTSLYAGAEEAATLQQQAGATLYAGGQSMKAAGAKTIAGLADQFPTLWEKYGGDFDTWTGPASEGEGGDASRPRPRRTRFSVVRGADGGISALDRFDL